MISLGFCLNLTDYGVNEELDIGYKILKWECKNAGTKLPENRKGSDLLVRELDCAVIQRVHKFHMDQNNKTYDSVRGVFIEGKQVYPNSGFMEKTHTQLCIVNPNCIKGYFSPREFDINYTRV